MKKKLRVNLKNEYVQLLFDCILCFDMRPVQEAFTHKGIPETGLKNVGLCSAHMCRRDLLSCHN